MHFAIFTSKRISELHISFLSRFKGPVSWYTIDLDLPPSKRWTALITDKKTEVRGLPATGEQEWWLLTWKSLRMCLFSAGWDDPSHQGLGQCLCSQWEADRTDWHHAGQSSSVTDRHIFGEVKAHLYTFCCFWYFPASDGRHSPKPVWRGDQGNRCSLGGSSR